MIFNILLSSIVGFGLFIGLVLRKIAVEEVTAGKNNLKLLRNLLAVGIIITVYTIVLIKLSKNIFLNNISQNYILGIIIATILIITLMLNKISKLAKKDNAHNILFISSGAILAVITTTCTSSTTIVISSLIFLYGFPIGSLSVNKTELINKYGKFLISFIIITLLLLFV